MACHAGRPLLLRLRRDGLGKLVGGGIPKRSPLLCHQIVQVPKGAWFPAMQPCSLDVPLLIEHLTSRPHTQHRRRAIGTACRAATQMSVPDSVGSNTHQPQCPEHTRLSTAFGMLAPLQCLQKHCAGHQSHHQCEVKRMGQKQANWVLVRVQRGNASYARDSHGRACSQQLVSVLCGYVPTCMQQCEATRDACSEASVKHQ